MMSWSTNFIITIITQPKFLTTLSPSSVVQCDRVVENLGYVMIAIIKFVDQDIIESLSCFLYMHQSVEFINVIYIYIYNVDEFLYL